MGSFGKEGRHAKVPCETHGSVGDDKKREIREQENAFAQRLMANNDDDFPTIDGKDDDDFPTIVGQGCHCHAGRRAKIVNVSTRALLLFKILTP